MQNQGPLAPISSNGNTNNESQLVVMSRPREELFPLSVTSLQNMDYPSDYGLPTSNAVGPQASMAPLPRCYSSLQPNLFPTLQRGGIAADEQYPTSFRSPYIHTADSGPSAIVYYPNSSTTDSNCGGQVQVNHCDMTQNNSDSAALQRLSQLLTPANSNSGTEVSSVQVKSPPMASQDEDLSSELTNNEAQVSQEIDDAFDTLDQEEELKLVVSAPTNI